MSQKNTKMETEIFYHDISSFKLTLDLYDVENNRTQWKLCKRYFANFSA